VQEVEAEFGLHCVSILTLADLIGALESSGKDAAHISAPQLEAMRSYRAQYGLNQ
jgi:orotate phosphoribosyltransferase